MSLSGVSYFDSLFSSDLMLPKVPDTLAPETPPVINTDRIEVPGTPEGAAPDTAPTLTATSMKPKSPDNLLKFGLDTRAFFEQTVSDAQSLRTELETGIASGKEYPADFDAGTSAGMLSAGERDVGLKFFRFDGADKRLSTAETLLANSKDTAPETLQKLQNDVEAARQAKFEAQFDLENSLASLNRLSSTFKSASTKTPVLGDIGATSKVVAQSLIAGAKLTSSVAPNLPAAQATALDTQLQGIKSMYDQAQVLERQGKVDQAELLYIQVKADMSNWTARQQQVAGSWVDKTFYKVKADDSDWSFDWTEIAAFAAIVSPLIMGPIQYSMAAKQSEKERKWTDKQNREQRQWDAEQARLNREASIEMAGIQASGETRPTSVGRAASVNLGGATQSR